MSKPKVLHLGCSNVPMQEVFEKIYPDGFEEIRVDIEKCRCDVKADVRDLKCFADHTADAIYAAHLLEHFNCRERDALMKEWCRVLKPGGIMYFILPRVDATEVVQALQNDTLEEPLYESPAGPVNAMHILYGQWYPGQYEVHKWGYTRRTLQEFLEKYLTQVLCQQDEFELFAYGWILQETEKKIRCQ